MSGKNTYTVYIKGREAPLHISADRVTERGDELRFRDGDSQVARVQKDSLDAWIIESVEQSSVHAAIV